MTRASLIRNWLLAQPGERGDGHLSAAFSTTCIAKGVGENGEAKVAYAIGSMFKDEHLGRIGGGRTGLYYVARISEPKRRMPDVERRRRKAAYEDNRRRKHGIITLAELQDLRAQRCKAAQDRKTAKRQAKRLRTTEPQPKPKPKPPTKRFLVVPEKPRPVAKPTARVQTVEQWMAAGNNPQVLPAFVWSTPLRSAP